MLSLFIKQCQQLLGSLLYGQRIKRILAGLYFHRVYKFIDKRNLIGKASAVVSDVVQPLFNDLGKIL